MSYGSYFLLSLLLTLTTEIPVLFFIANYLLKIKTQEKEILYWSIFVNLFSLPYLWFVFPLFIPIHNYVLVGEILVVLMETAVLLKALRTNLQNAFALSLIANLASYLAGIAVLR